MDPISIIVTIVVIGLLYWLVTLIPLPHPFPLIVQVVFILIVVLYLVRVFLPGIHIGGL